MLYSAMNQALTTAAMCNKQKLCSRHRWRDRVAIDMPSFANPLGLWALMGIPVILLIHFLQRKAMILPVSTLFLLEKTQREASTGRNFDRITHSIPLWMQILAVMLLAWLLAEPRFPMARSTQRIAIVVDSSASMAVFKEKMIAGLQSELPKLKGFATDVEYTLLESTAGKPRIYAGTSTINLLASLEAWRPTAGLTDPAQSLRLARSLVSREGIVIYASDTPADGLPFDAKQLAIGQAIENVGFTGVAFETKDQALLWRVTIQNYSDKKITRTWQMDMGNGALTEPKTIEMESRSLTTLQSNFPSQAMRIKIMLSPDDFAMDDTLYLIRPAPKKLLWFTSPEPSLASLNKKLLRAIDNMTIATQAKADISLISYDPLDPTPIDGNAIVFVNDATQGGQYLSGGIIAEKNPLVDGLNWQALLIRETIALEIRPSDQVLLFQDKRPLILLREIPATQDRPAAQQLHFNFDPRLSNLETQPSLIVILHRFAEQVRARKIALAQENLETSQPLAIATKSITPAIPLTLNKVDHSGKVLEKKQLSSSQQLLFPDEPGYYQYRQGEDLLLDAASYFADTREADFRQCAEANTLTEAQATAIQAHSVGDPYWQYWIFALLAALLASWHFIKERKQPTMA